MTESLEGVYKRQLQGAWVRSVASVFMWFYSLITIPLMSPGDGVYPEDQRVA